MEKHCSSGNLLGKRTYAKSDCQPSQSHQEVQSEHLRKGCSVLLDINTHLLEAEPETEKQYNLEQKQCSKLEVGN